MPEPLTAYSLFFGELGWSRAFNALLGDSLELEYPESPEGERCPAPLHQSALQHVAESGGYDCSLVASHSLYRPSFRLVKAMGLRWTGHGADFVDGKGRLVAFDPSVHDTCESALLVREESLAPALKEMGLALVWAIVGEKRVIIPNDYSETGPGFLHLTGASVYRLERLTGDLTAYHEPPITRR